MVKTFIGTVLSLVIASLFWHIDRVASVVFVGFFLVFAVMSVGFISHLIKSK